MSKITIDLVKLIEQAISQVSGSADRLLLEQWLARNTGTKQPVTVDLTTLQGQDDVAVTALLLSQLQSRINDVTTFGDDSELRIHVLAPPGNVEDLATSAYYGLLGAISDI